MSSGTRLAVDCYWWQFSYFSVWGVWFFSTFSRNRSRLLKYILPGSAWDDAIWTTQETMKSGKCGCRPCHFTLPMTCHWCQIKEEIPILIFTLSACWDTLLLMTSGSGSRTCKHAQPWQLPNVPPLDTIMSHKSFYTSTISVSRIFVLMLLLAATHHSCNLRFWDWCLASTGLRWVSGSRA